MINGWMTDIQKYIATVVVDPVICSKGQDEGHSKSVYLVCKSDFNYYIYRNIDALSRKASCLKHVNF